MMGSSSFFNQQNSRGIMGEQVYKSSSSSESELESDDLMEEVNSSSSGSGSPAAAGDGESGALNDMSSLLQQLPFKRGLSKHFEGKSQSFTSLSNVMCLEDLAKPENPYNKKLKSCRSYMGLKHFSDQDQPKSASSSSRLISNKSSTRASCAKRSSTFLGISNNKPPPHRSQSTSSFTNQSFLLSA